ncbi:cytochrome c biogenesis protein CcsA [Thalassotalea nanhaiensis]|uniref:Cytochrome c biogenesis protein CcsA n=1 Tax=Thalassotalea nanhaiensis TaxID=3065648 RepID=A0ABY9TMC3_9GAMM|nr:cytochrome c biogenesis protein CcsA [Colwelliaceae bacterium SQ345]
MDLVSFLTIAVITLYVAAALAVSSKLFDTTGPNPKVYLTLGCMAVVGHSLLLSKNIFFHNDVDFSLVNVIALVAFIISFSVTLISIRFKANLILPVVYAFSAILHTVLFFVPEDHHLVIDPTKIPLVIHITLALLSYGILVIATLYAFQVSYINYKLKSKKISAVNHLPPLMQVEGQLFSIMFAGIICLILSQAVGLVFIESFFAPESLHKTLLSLFALAIYLIIMRGHYKMGWRGNKVLVLSVVATSLLTLSYFGSRFVKEFLLS